MNAGIIYYTDNRLPFHIMQMCQKSIRSSGLPIVSSSLAPIEFGINKVMVGKRGYLTLFKQIVDCLERAWFEIVFFCEHDVIYNWSHFVFKPQREDTYYYNNNVWKWNGKEAVTYDCRWLSQMCCYKHIALEHFRKKIEFELNGIKKRFEPGTRKGIDNYKTVQWESERPNVDLRHGSNLTGTSRFNLEDFRSKPKNFKKSDKVPYYGKIILEAKDGL